LYYRLNVLPFRVPSLRERSEAIGLARESLSRKIKSLAIEVERG
jgi:transcriptional regulator with GAF, ATPase, and Fis domain